IAVWHLERVIDLNGNLTQFVYQQDQKNTAHPTPFDNATRVDFRQAYLSEVHYSGKAARTGPDAVDVTRVLEPGIYAVYFQRAQDGQGGLLDRPDIVVNARTGFKVVTRHLLERIQVAVLAGPPSQQGV